MLNLRVYIEHAFRLDPSASTLLYSRVRVGGNKR